jgi:hypothetical protein
MKHYSITLGDITLAVLLRRPCVIFPLLHAHLFFIYFSPLKCVLRAVRVNSLDYVTRMFGEKENAYHEVILFRPSLFKFIRLKHSQSYVLQHDQSISVSFTVIGHASYWQTVNDRNFVYFIICIGYFKLFYNVRVLQEHLVEHTFSRTDCTLRLVALLRHIS